MKKLLLLALPTTCNTLTYHSLSARTISSSFIVFSKRTTLSPYRLTSIRDSFLSPVSGTHSICRNFVVMSSSDALSIDPFAYRQFSESDASSNYKGTVFSISMDEFTKIANERYDESLLKDGYAPFCKHLFLVNDFTDARVNVLPITSENESFLRCKYEARNEKELPVLSRYFPNELVTSESNPLPVGKYLDLILYSREQIKKENEAMGNDSKSDTPWGIVSIKCQDVDFELPMQPITAMRNALGADQGGSGIPLDREKYLEAYNFWKDHAVVS